MSENLSKRAYDHILSMVIGGQLRPGTRVSHRAVAKALDVSIIPVREAIGHLVSEGLLRHEAGVGTSVPQLDHQEIQELYDIREVLECHAAERAATRIGEIQLVDMERHAGTLEQIVQSLAGEGRTKRTHDELERWRLADMAMHAVMLRAAGNSYLSKIVFDLKLMTRVFAHTSADEPIEYLHQTCEDHRHILEALRQGDVEQARTATSRHIRQGYRTICELSSEAANTEVGPDEHPMATIVSLREQFQNPKATPRG